MNATRDGARLEILVVSKFYWPAPGGQAKVLRSLCEAWVADGHDVEVLTTRSVRSPAARSIEAGIRVRRIPAIPIDYVEVLWFMLWVYVRVALGRRPDVVVVSMLKHGAVAALSAGGGRRIPVVLRTEGGGETGDVAWHRQARAGAAIRDRCRRADRIVAISEPIRDELLEAGFPAERIASVPNAVDRPARPWSSRDAPRARRSLGIPERPTAVFTGRLLVAKGLCDLVDALAIAIERGAPLQAVLVGEGRDRAVVERRVAERGLDERVRLVGHVGNVDDYLAAGELFVLPSHAEGMSIALLEALARGMPVVASDIPANRRLALDRWIRFHRPADPEDLARALSEAIDEAGAGVDRDACRADVERAYGAASVARRYVALFEELQAPRRASPVAREPR